MNPLQYNIDLKKKFKFGTNATATELIVHEVGHNSARNAAHTEEGTGNYEYTQIGLQSNEKGRIFVTPENRTNIINDEKNRSNSVTIDLSRLKPNLCKILK